ncbi:MAG: hypothetical protein K2Q22_06520, partial [Cytophagales bacterium]|nr:hypothetical protein [Cytophagales bacterium]
MKKLILAFLAVGFAFAASAQLKPTFVYDDGTIRSGYFDVSSGFGGIYWSQGAAPTPYAIDSTKRTTGIVAAISMNSSNVTISPRACGQTST